MYIYDCVSTQCAASRAFITITIDASIMQCKLFVQLTYYKYHSNCIYGIVNECPERPPNAQGSLHMCGQKVLQMVCIWPCNWLFDEFSNVIHSCSVVPVLQGPKMFGRIKRLQQHSHNCLYQSFMHYVTHTFDVTWLQLLGLNAWTYNVSCIDRWMSSVYVRAMLNNVCCFCMLMVANVKVNAFSFKPFELQLPITLN